MKILNVNTLNATEVKQFNELQASPVTILQIGEGNFLRGFFDWMIHESRKQGLFGGSIAVTQPRPTGKPKIDALARQDGLYTLVIRGIENGESVERKELISVFSQVFDPYTEWNRLIELAVSPDLQFIVSNTTEAGLAYRPETLIEGKAIESFPGKVAYLLYKRFMQYNGSVDHGLIIVPCELIERNGDVLRAAVLQYAKDWELPEAFQVWVTAHNRFLNSLVDRIVTGYPDAEQAEAWFAEWGYKDEQLSTAEPYHLWAIEAEAELDKRLPLQQAGLNVHWVDDLKPFQQRKVRILNGAHTLMTPIGLLHEVEHVRELMEHDYLGAFVRKTVQEHIIPTLPFPADEMKEYAEAVFERYLNPYIRHRLSDIAMNSISKFKVRVLPSLAYYAERGERIPQTLLTGFAGLLRYYKTKRKDGAYEGHTLLGKSYILRDDAKSLETIANIWEEAEQENQTPDKTIERLLKEESLWGQDLTSWSGLTDEITTCWIAITKEVQQ